MAGQPEDPIAIEFGRFKVIRNLGGRAFDALLGEGVAGLVGIKILDRHVRLPLQLSASRALSLWES